jgi:hypothetical protein
MTRTFLVKADLGEASASVRLGQTATMLVEMPKTNGHQQAAAVGAQGRAGPHGGVGGRPQQHDGHAAAGEARRRRRQRCRHRRRPERRADRRDRPVCMC